MRYSAWYHGVFSIALATMAYGFALSGGRFSVFVLAQGLVFLIAVLGILFPGYARLRTEKHCVCTLHRAPLDGVGLYVCQYLATQTLGGSQNLSPLASRWNWLTG